MHVLSTLCKFSRIRSQQVKGNDVVSFVCHCLIRSCSFRQTNIRMILFDQMNGCQFDQMNGCQPLSRSIRVLNVFRRDIPSTRLDIVIATWSIQTSVVLWPILPCSVFSSPTVRVSLDRFLILFCFVLFLLWCNRSTMCLLVLVNRSHRSWIYKKCRQSFKLWR